MVKVKKLNIIFIFLMFSVILIISAKGIGIDLSGDYGGTVEKAVSFAYTLYKKGFKDALRDYIISSKIPPVQIDNFIIFLISLFYILIFNLPDLILISNLAKLIVLLLKTFIIYLILKLYLGNKLPRKYLYLYVFLILFLDNYWLSSLLSDALDRPLLQIYLLFMFYLYSCILLGYNSNINKIILVLFSWIISLFHPHIFLIVPVLFISFIILTIIKKLKSSYLIFLSFVSIIISYIVHYEYLYNYSHGYTRSEVSYVLSQYTLGHNWYTSFTFLNTEISNWKKYLSSIGLYNIIVIILFTTIISLYRDKKYMEIKLLYFLILLGTLIFSNYITYGYIQAFILEKFNLIFLIRVLSRYDVYFGIILTIGVIFMHNKLNKKVNTLFAILLIITAIIIYYFNYEYLLQGIKNYSYINEIYIKMLYEYFNFNNTFYGIIIQDPKLPTSFSINNGAYDVFQKSDILWLDSRIGNYSYRFFGVKYRIYNLSFVIRYDSNSRVLPIEGFIVPLTNLSYAYEIATKVYNNESVFEQNSSFYLVISYSEFYNNYKKIISYNIPVIFLIENIEDENFIKAHIENASMVIPFYTLIRQKYLVNILVNQSFCKNDPIVLLGVISPIDHRVFNTFSMLSYKYDKVLLSDYIVKVNYNNYKCFNQLSPSFVMNLNQVNYTFLRVLFYGNIKLKINYNLDGLYNINNTILLTSERYEIKYLVIYPINMTINTNKLIISFYIDEIKPNSVLVLDSIIYFYPRRNITIDHMQNKFLYINTSSIYLNSFNLYEKLKNYILSISSSNSKFIAIYNPGYKPSIEISGCNHIMKTLSGFDVFVCQPNLYPYSDYIYIKYEVELKYFILFIENLLAIAIFIFIVALSKKL